MAHTGQEILDEFPGLVSLVAGDPTTKLLGPCPQENLKPGALAFVAKEELIPAALKSEVAGLIVDQKHQAAADSKSKALVLSSPNLRLAMAKINRRFFSVEFQRKPFAGELVHESSYIHPEAKVHESVCIGPNVVIHESVEIAANCFIGANTVIEANVQIGEDCFIHPSVYIGHSTRIGKRCEIQPNTTLASDGFGYAQDENGNSHRIPHYGEVILEDDVHIGANCSIDRGTFEPSVIGAGTKVDNLCHFGHNLTLGKNCLVTAGFISAGSVKIGDNCVFAGRVGVNGHIEMGDNITIGPCSAVTGNLMKPGAYGGFPVIPWTNFRKVQASLAHLPRLRKNVSKLMKKVGLEEA